MATSNDPTAPVLRAVEAYQSRLFELWKVTFKKVNAKFNAARSFFDNVINRGEEIASKVGKAVVDRLAQLGQGVFAVIDTVPGACKSALRLGNKIIALIRKAADPNRIIGTLKKLFHRYVKMLRDIYAGVVDFLSALDPLATALAVVNTFRNVLRLVVSWVGEVSGANSAVKKARSLVKRAVKAMKLEIKEAIRLRKQVLKLKPA